jgi:hypothetical protein
MKFNFIEGSTPNEKFNHIERVLRRMSLRLHKTIVGIIPPTIVFEYVQKPPEDGVLLRAILPSGKLTKGFMYVEKYAGTQMVNFSAEIHKTDGSLQTKKFTTRKQSLVIEPDLPVDIGDRLIFKADDPLSVEGIWIGFMFQIDRKDSIQETFVIDQIERLLEENNASKDTEEGKQVSSEYS